jgi:GAF domain-containing protein
MTLLTPSHQWFKSRHGLDMIETPRSWAFCNQTILQRDVFEIDDLAGDTRFGNNPAVAGAPHFRFYAGAPVIDPDGYALGSVCVMDYVPRTLDQDEKRTLLALAAIASDEVRLRATDRQLRWTQTELERSRTRAPKH